MALPPGIAASPNRVMAVLLVVCLIGIGLFTFVEPADLAWAQTSPPAQITNPPVQPTNPPAPATNPLTQAAASGGETESLIEAVTRLPLAAALGAALALRPRRKGTPARSTA